MSRITALIQQATAFVCKSQLPLGVRPRMPGRVSKPSTVLARPAAIPQRLSVRQMACGPDQSSSCHGKPAGGQAKFLPPKGVLSAKASGRVVVAKPSTAAPGPAKTVPVRAANPPRTALRESKKTVARPVKPPRATGKYNISGRVGTVKLTTTAPAPAKRAAVRPANPSRTAVKYTSSGRVCPVKPTQTAPVSAKVVPEIATQPAPVTDTSGSSETTLAIKPTRLPVPVKSSRVKPVMNVWPPKFRLSSLLPGIRPESDGKTGIPKPTWKSRPSLEQLKAQLKAKGAEARKATRAKAPKSKTPQKQREYDYDASWLMEWIPPSVSVRSPRAQRPVRKRPTSGKSKYQHVSFTPTLVRRGTGESGVHQSPYADMGYGLHDDSPIPSSSGNKNHHVLFTPTPVCEDIGENDGYFSTCQGMRSRYYDVTPIPFSWDDSSVFEPHDWSFGADTYTRVN